ncbi:MAG: hypothetical protein KME30_10300 [Iphinoe sp. HA4291-MV1]|nr:hypothetical protein [Iphinoe sp. HA4291-MV1]
MQSLVIGAVLQCAVPCRFDYQLILRSDALGGSHSKSDRAKHSAARNHAEVRHKGEKYELYSF